jgi:hypothetical protein
MEQDTQKLSTMEQFENAMSQDAQFGGGGPVGGGWVVPAVPVDRAGREQVRQARAFRR